LWVDKYFVHVASEFLNTIPVLDFIVGMNTISGYTDFDKLNGDAMLFHFDKDRLRWLKCFIYLDDVTDENGPHVYVSGSHKNRAGSLLRDERFTDSDIESYYGEAAIKKITGVSGTIFLPILAVFIKGL